MRAKWSYRRYFWGIWGFSTFVKHKKLERNFKLKSVREQKELLYLANYIWSPKMLFKVGHFRWVPRGPLSRALKCPFPEGTSCPLRSLKPRSQQLLRWMGQYRTRLLPVQGAIIRQFFHVVQHQLLLFLATHCTGTGLEFVAAPVLGDECSLGSEYFRNWYFL